MNILSRNGVTDHIWTVGELIEAAELAGAEPPTPIEPNQLMPVRQRPALRVIRGGLS